MSDPADLFLTVHQHLDNNGYPVAAGSEVRMPDGTVIPRVESVKIEANAYGERLWMATIRVPVLFGDPIVERKT